MKCFRATLTVPQFHYRRCNIEMQPAKNTWMTPDIVAHDLYYVLEYPMWFCRVFGIFSLTLEGPATNRSYSRSYVYVIYGFILTVLELISLILTVNFDYAGNIRFSTQSVLVAIIYLQYVLIAIVTIVTYISGVLTTSKVADALRAINSLDSLLQKLGVPTNYPGEFRRTCTYLGISVTTMSICLVFDLLCDVGIKSRSLLVWIVGVYPAVTAHLITYLFTSILLAIRTRFNSINETLQKMIDESNSPTSQTLVTHRMHVPKIRLIATAHGMLCESTNNLTETFGFSIVAIVANALVLVTTILYFSFHHVRSQTTIEIELILMHLNWGTLNFSVIILIVLVCTSTRQQANLTAKLINKLDVYGHNTPFTAAVGIDLITLIQMFSMQLNHQKVEFSAAGFFELDSSLLQSIIGAVTTYLIILIQFDNPSVEK